MRKGLIYATLLVAALLVPTESVKLGEIRPVELVSIRYQDNQIVLETDTEDIGAGNDLDAALKNLYETSTGRVYLDTAKFLLVEESAAEQAQKLSVALKDNVRVCCRNGDMDIKEATEYLRQHNPDMKLKQWGKETNLQTLKAEKGRMKLSEKK